tara:strand:- start:474 stop:806 length:333 start_codon:yes stop_codon:yes gene_type:complete
MKKIKKNKNKKRKVKNGDGLLFSISFVCLLALVGLVYLLISQQIEVLSIEEDDNSLMILHLKDSRASEQEWNDELFSNESILSLLQQQNSFGSSLLLGQAKDTIYIKGLN